MTSENGRVHPNCVNASNPYHECGMACLEKIAQGQGRKEMPKKKLDYHNGVKDGVISKMKNEERKVNPNCIKASNPYHKCGDNCFKRNGEANTQGFKKQSGSWSFGRKNKEYDPQPDSPRGSAPRTPRTPRTPQLVAKVAAGGQKPDTRHARSENHPNTNVVSENGKSLPSEYVSGEIRPDDHSFSKEKISSIQSVPLSENVKMNDRSKEPSNVSVTSPTVEAPSKNAKDANVQTSLEINHHDEFVEEDIVSPADRSRNFSFSGIDIASGDSDDEEAQSVISDSVSVGKYHVRASISSILQSIINRYGDIAANCKLESNSMRAYYLECLCSVVEELRSTSLMQMTKAKVKEMQAVLKDVESAQIDVDWLRNILNEISEAIEFSTQHQTLEAAKANCDNLLGSMRKELESQMKELDLKEKEVADLKELVTKTKAKLSDLEAESGRLEQTIQDAQSKARKFSHKSVADEIL